MVFIDILLCITLFLIKTCFFTPITFFIFLNGVSLLESPPFLVVDGRFTQTTWFLSAQLLSSTFSIEAAPLAALQQGKADPCFYDPVPISWMLTLGCSYALVMTHKTQQRHPQSRFYCDGSTTRSYIFAGKIK